MNIEFYKEYRALLDNKNTTINDIKNLFKKMNIGKKFMLQALYTYQLRILNGKNDDFSLLNSCFNESQRFCYEKEETLDDLRDTKDLSVAKMGDRFATFIMYDYLPLIFYLQSLNILTGVTTSEFITDSNNNSVNMNILFGKNTVNEKSLKLNEFISLIFKIFSENMMSGKFNPNQYIKDELLDIIRKCDSHFKYTSKDSLTEKPPVGTLLKNKQYIVNPAVGRLDEKTNLAVSMLMQETSAILVGPAGVGKTAIVEGLNYDIQNGNVPIRLKDKQILMTSSTELVSGCSLVGMLEERFLRLCNYAKTHPEVIMFIDEIHTLIGGGRGSGSTNELSNMFKPYLSSGELQLIGATTIEEYERYFSKESAFRRRFERILVNEPDEDTLRLIISNTVDKLAQQTGISFTSDSDLLLYADTIVKYTADEYRDKNDYLCNPAIAINILKRTFANAEYNSHNNIDENDIATAVNDCSYTLAKVDSRKL